MRYRALSLLLAVTVSVAAVWWASGWLTSEPTNSTLTPIPGGVNGSFGWHAAPYRQNDVWTEDSVQYAAWVSPDRVAQFGRRPLPHGTWQVADLSQIFGNPLRQPMEPDPHNVLSMGVDLDGQIHLAGNMHNDPLRYVRSGNGSTTFSAAQMIGEDEESISYPRFVRRADGRLLFVYRSMFDFLEHLPDYDLVRTMVHKAARVARDFILIRHPSFEDESYLRAIGFKQYWQDWPEAHPSHLLLSDLTEMLRSAGSCALELEYVDPVRDSSHPSILPLNAPLHQVRYDPATHGEKPHVTFTKPVHRQLRLRAHLTGGDLDVGRSRVHALERELANLRSRRAIRLTSAVWRFRQAQTLDGRIDAVKAAARTLTRG